MGSPNSKVIAKIDLHTRRDHIGYYYFNFTDRNTVAIQFRNPNYIMDDWIIYCNYKKAKQNLQTKILNGLLSYYMNKNHLVGKCKLGYHTYFPHNSGQLVINLIKLFNSSFCDTDENILLICKIMKTDSLNNERTQDLLRGTTQKMSKDQMIEYLKNELGYNNIGNIDALFN